MQSVIIFIRIIKVVHLKDAATGGGAAGGVGAEEDEVGQQDRHLGEHMDDFYIGHIYWSYMTHIWVIMYNIHCICMYTARVIDWNHR